MKTSKIILFLTIAFSNILGGCLVNEEMVETVNMSMSRDFDESIKAFETAKMPGKPVTKDVIAVSDEIWLGDSSFIVESKERLPEKFEGEEGLTILTDTEVTFDEIVGQISYLTGMPIQVEGSVEAGNILPLSLSYTGSLSGLLDMLALRANISWSYSNNKIVFYKFKTRTFLVHTLATESNYLTSISSGSDGSATLATTATLKEWKEMEEVLKIIVKEGEVQMSPSTNSITVTSTPSTLRKVEAYIKEQNRRFVKQVAITVRVLQVSLSKDNNFGLNLSALIDSSISLSSTSASTASNALSFAIIGGNSGLAGTSDNPTSLAIKALSSQGKTSLVTSAVVTARNNRVVPINNIQTFKYISSISTLTENADSTTEVTPEEETVGFSMQIMPNILENGKLVLLFNMSLKELVGIENVQTGSVSVQLPTIASRNFMQEIVMESGQTAVLTGFERAVSTNQSEGIGKQEFTYLGGYQQTETSREVLVVMLTPQVITSPLEEDDNFANDIWGMPTY